MLKAYKYQLKPTDEQKIFFAKCFGNARFVYNWALNEKIEDYKKAKEAGEKKLKVRSAVYELGRLLPSMKKTEQYQWLKDTPSMSLIYELNFLEDAYKNFFRRVKIKENPGFPKFKSRYDRQSFTDELSDIDFQKQQVKIPKIGWVKARLHRPFNGKFKRFTISKTPTGKYFISILVDDGLPDIEVVPSKEILGIDKGINNLITTSTGDQIKNPKFYEKQQKKIAVLQRRLAKKVKGSKNREEAKLKLARAFEDMVNKRSNFIHNLTHDLIEKSYDTYVVEGFDANKLAEGNRNAKNINDTGWGMITTQLEYKCKFKGKNFIKLDKKEATNKKCVKCQTINNQVKFWTKEWYCTECNELNIKGISSAILIKELASIV